MAQFDRFWRPAVEQKEVGDFLRTQTDLFVEDMSQQPSFDEGFSALRRNQLVKLAQKYGQELDDGMPATSMVPIFNAWWMQGFFHKPVHAVNAAKPLVIPEEMRTPDKGTRPVDDPLSDLNDLGWGALKKLARDKGYKVLPKMKRPEVEELFLG